MIFDIRQELPVYLLFQRGREKCAALVQQAHPLHPDGGCLPTDAA